jgi:hypothetical protein
MKYRQYRDLSNGKRKNLLDKEINNTVEQSNIIKKIIGFLKSWLNSFLSNE